LKARAGWRDRDEAKPDGAGDAGKADILRELAERLPD